ncbi:MAG TPA: carbohydrate-binding family 9-like protein [Bryobacteraceae bacterium]|nr:carbohydrate-binding family 9-like protein [Bryobacteraceae bacterium]
MKILALLLPLAALAFADSAGRMVSRYSKSDFPLSADPAAAQWKNIPAAIVEGDTEGKPVAGHRTEVRSRWTDKHLYVLYTCPYQELYLRPNPSQTEETNELWNWDVAEIFAGTDFKDIRHYTEYEISPQGEWVDLDINRNTNPPAHNVKWDSGFQVKARIDRDHKVWYGEMQIPFTALGLKPAKGAKLRVNLFRAQGPEPRKFLSWQPTHSETFHVPEAFGLMVLE